MRKIFLFASSILFITAIFLWTWGVTSGYMETTGNQTIAVDVIEYPYRPISIVLFILSAILFITSLINLKIRCYESDTLASDRSLSDSDGDGAPDWFEISYMGYNADTDGDGLKNPWDWDSDGDLISDGDEIEINPQTDDVRIITNPLVYNDFDDNRTEINQGIECDALGVSDDNMASVVVDYNTASTEIPQVTRIGEQAYSVNVTSTSTTGLKAEVRIKPNDSTMEALRTDPYTYRMYYLDTSTNQWKLAAYTDVDIEGGYVWGVTEHFSDYAIKDTSTRDSDGDGLTDYYEFTHRYTVKEYVCHFDPAWEGWAPAGGLPAWSLSVSADPSHLLFWKASGTAASSFEMMTSTDFNLEMSRLSPLYLEFDYRYSVADTSISIVADTTKTLKPLSRLNRRWPPHSTACLPFRALA